jgi:dihydroorotase
MYHKVGHAEPGYEERETIVNGLSVAAKAALRLCFATPPPLTIKHKLTLFRIRRGVLQLFPIGALTKGSEGRDMAEIRHEKLWSDCL